MLQELGRVLVVVLGVYGDPAVRRFLPSRRAETGLPSPVMKHLFWLEILLSIVLPLISAGAARKCATAPNGLYLAAVLVVFGFITNRMNVSITGFESDRWASVTSPSGPSWRSPAMIIAIGFAIFGVAVKYLPIFPKEELQCRHVEPELSPWHRSVPEHAGD